LPAEKIREYRGVLTHLAPRDRPLAIGKATFVPNRALQAQSLIRK